MKRVSVLATPLAESNLSQRITNRPCRPEDPARRVPRGLGQTGVPAAGGDEDRRGRRAVGQQQPADQGGEGTNRGWFGVGKVGRDGVHGGIVAIGGQKRSRRSGCCAPVSPKTMVERVPQSSRPGFGVKATAGSRLPGGHAGATDAVLGPQKPEKQPISRPGARAGVIWLESQGLGESYTAGYPDGHRDGGACRWQIGVSYRLGTDDI